jgi:hypothetical protein
VVVGVLVWLIIFIKILIIITTRANYANNKKRIGDVYIGGQGAYLNRRLHTWWTTLSWLEEATINKEINCLDITYSMPARHWRDSQIVHIPIPAGKEDEVPKVIEELAKTIKK